MAVLPATLRGRYGDVVPMPTLPFVVKVPFEVVVALPPIHELPDIDRFVVEAPPFKEDSPETVRPLNEIVPVAEIRHVPLKAKHPSCSVIPLLNVDVELPVMFKALAAIPPVKVEVAVPVTVRLATVVVPSWERPMTEREVEVAFVARRLVKMELVA